MRELSHRSKNLLAVVQAIAGQTARHSPGLEDFQTRFSAAHLRHGALARTCWSPATGRARPSPTSCAPSWRRSRRMPPRASRSRARDLVLKPDAVHSLTLALHELATNAAKYGALSVPDGRVAIDWEIGGRPQPWQPLPHELARDAAARR